MVRIRLRRMGIKHKPAYRVVVADSRAPRDGKFIETIGHYNPQLQPKVLFIKEDRARYWLGVGAQPSDTVVRLLKSVNILDGEGNITAGDGAPAQTPAPATKPAPRKKPVAQAKPATPAVATSEAKPVTVAAVAPASDSSNVVATPLQKGAHKGSVKTAAQLQAPEGYTIKGNESSLIYHVPGSRYYDATEAEFWFDTVENAEAAGFRTPSNQKDDEVVEATPAVAEKAPDTSNVVLASASEPKADVVEAKPEAAEEKAEAASYKGSVKSLASGRMPKGYEIKGNESSMLYHVPGSRYYNTTKAEVWFDTTENAEAAGFRAPGSQKHDEPAKPKYEAGPHKGSVMPLASGKTPEGYDIKGNESSMLYHVPGSRYYNVTHAEYWFDTVENAEAAGFKATKAEAEAEEA